jgi:hypothetical protein
VFQRLMDSPHCVRDTRVLAHPTDAFLPFLAAPNVVCCANSRATSLHCGAAKLSVAPTAAATLNSVLVDPPASSDAPDFSYEADASATVTVPVASAIATLPTLMPAASLQLKKFATGMNWSRR